MTDKQREAARDNGRKSRGPVSAEGKLRSSLNARRHELAAKSLVLNAEEQADFDRMLDAYAEQLQPENEIEADLVEQMAAAKWRERRCWLHQKSLLEHNVAYMASYLRGNLSDAARFALALKADGDSSRFQLLQRYESMHTRTWRRAWRDLLEIRKLQNEPSKGLKPAESIPEMPPNEAKEAA